LCLPVSRLFWVSSLAYPNLLGTKGYVVVVYLYFFMCFRTQKNSSFNVLTARAPPSVNTRTEVSISAHAITDGVAPGLSG
jgi:hypothetical protein